MAEILAGQTQHSHFAPLSHGQTLAIGSHLLELIAKVDARVAELGLGLDQTNADLSNLREGVSHTNTAVHALQDALAGTNQAVDGTRKDLIRANGFLQTLQGGLQSCNENVVALTEGHKINTTSLDQAMQEGKHTKQLALQLQETIEKTLIVDITKLREDLSKTNLEVK